MAALTPLVILRISGTLTSTNRSNDIHFQPFFVTLRVLRAFVVRSRLRKMHDAHL